MPDWTRAPLRELRPDLETHGLHRSPALLAALVVRPHELDEEELQRSLGDRWPRRRHPWCARATKRSPPARKTNGVRVHFLARSSGSIEPSWAHPSVIEATAQR